MNFFSYFEQYYVALRYGPTFVITAVILSLALSVMFNTFQKRWSYLLRILIDSACVFLIQIFLNCLNFYALYSLNLSAVDRYSMFYVWLLVALIHTAYPRKESYSMRLAYALMTNTFFVCLLTMSGGLGGLVTAALGVQSSVFSDLTFYLIVLTTFALMVFLKAFPIEQCREVPASGILIVDGIFAVSAVLLFLCAYFYDYETAWYPTLVSLFLLLLDTGAYCLFYLTIRSYNHALVFQAKELKAENEASQVELSASKYEELHRIRHDIKNQFAYIHQLLQAKEYDKLETYFSDLDENTRLAVDFIDCGNSTLNYILSVAKTKADSRNIPFETTLQVPAQLAIRDSDLVSLLSNLLDNALEGTLASGKKDAIRVSISLKDNYLFLVISNPVSSSLAPERILSMATTKKDKEHHGYGSKIIQDIVARYHGVITNEIKDGLFVASVMLCDLKDQNWEEDY